MSSKFIRYLMLRSILTKTQTELVFQQFTPPNRNRIPPSDRYRQSPPCRL